MRLPTLLRTWLGRAPAAPPTPEERRGLEHRRRALERELRGLRKVLDRRGCASCVSAPPDPTNVRLQRRKDAVVDEMERIDARLDA